MDKQYYKLKYFKYKAKYYKLLEQNGGMYTENPANPFARNKLPEPDAQGRIYTDPSQPLDFLTEEQRQEWYDKWEKDYSKINQK
jgi:hypothetical protein